MAFKKKKDKKSKKKKTKRDDEWTHEGGVRVAVDEGASSEPKRRVRTQERDEQFRRSRLKQEERKRKLEFAHKMSKKVKFSDILNGGKPADDSEHSDNELSNDEDGDASAAAPQRIPNPAPIVDRLQALVSRGFVNSTGGGAQGQSSVASAKEAKRSAQLQSSGAGQTAQTPSSSSATAAAATSNISAEEEVDERSGSLSTGQPSKSSSDESNFALTFGAQAQLASVDDVEAEDVLSDDGSEADGNASNTRNANHSWFFDQSSEDASELTKSVEPAPSVLPGVLQTALHPQLPSPPSSITALQQVPGLYKLWKNRQLTLSPIAQALLPKLVTYADCFVDGRDFRNDASLLEAYLMHSVFHLVKSRAKVLKHNQRLKKRLAEQKLRALESKPKTRATRSTASHNALSEESSALDEHSLRDQGFTRPRLLILCPFRSTAKQIVQCLLSIFGENTSVAGMEKFHSEFADQDSDDEDDDAAHTLSEKERKRRERGKSQGPTQKPWDWEQTFGKNLDDDFKLGIQVNPGRGKGSGPDKGCYLRLFSDFYISDIILASPLGLKLIIERDSGVDDSLATSTSRGEKGRGKKGAGGGGADFLSSIEQVVIHQADVLSMQNWDHVEYLLSRANQLPRQARAEVDYSRVRTYFLDQAAARHRQVMMSSYFASPELQSFFRRHGCSRAGQVRFKKDWQGLDTLAHVAVPCKQVFQVVPLSGRGKSAALEQYEENKFRYFVDHVLQPLLKKQQKRTMIVAPSYLDYVRIRNYLMQQEASCVYVCEYSRESENSRSRAWFFHGVKNLMVYSGRMHFYRRFKIRGAHTIIFYSLPEYPHFYPELVNMLSASYPSRADSAGDAQEQLQEQLRRGEDSLSALVLTSKLEKMALERVVGPQRAEHMFQSDRSTFVFF